jgi:hypothetical protein
MVCINTLAADVIVAAGSPTVFNPELIRLCVIAIAANTAISSFCMLMVTSTSIICTVSILRRPSRTVRTTRLASLLVKPAVTAITSLNACCTLELKSANFIGRLTDKLTVGVGDFKGLMFVDDSPGFVVMIGCADSIMVEVGSGCFVVKTILDMVDATMIVEGMAVAG